MQYSEHISRDPLEHIWLKLRGIERRKETGTFELRSEQDDHHWLIVAESDQGGIVIDGCYFSMRLGAVFICSSNQRVEWIDSELEGRSIYLLRFEMNVQARESTYAMTINGERQDGSLQLHGEYQIMPLVSAIEKCHIIERYWNSGKVPDRFYSEAAFHELLGMILNSSFQGTTIAVERARRELEERFVETVSIDHLAELAGMSRYHFMRLFKEKYRKSVGDYVTELRLNEAKRLMAEPNELTLRDIAERVGYNNAAYFSRLFKKQVGFAPVVYLRNQALKVAAYSWANVGQLIPLQIIPYAAPIDQYWDDYYRKRYQADVAVHLSHDYEFNRKALCRARPDCIITLDYLMPDEELEKLEQIAPVLRVPWEGTDWRGHLRVVADFINKAKEAENWLSHYDLRVEMAKRLIPVALREKDTLILKVSGRQLSIVGRRAASVLYNDLQLIPPLSLKEGNDWLRTVTVEQVGAYMAANFLVSVNEDAVSQAVWMELQQSESWRGLQAVRDEAVFHLPGSPWFEYPWGEYSAFSHGRMLEEVVSGAWRR